jgi:hypothetical protein
MTGMKFDKGKLLYDLITPEFLEGLAAVLTHGAEKYEPNNWQFVENGVSRYRNALYRHLEAIRKGEYIDPDSGLPHYYHCAANLMFLSYIDKAEPAIQKDTPNNGVHHTWAVGTGLDEVIALAQDY